MAKYYFLETLKSVLGSSKTHYSSNIGELLDSYFIAAALVVFIFPFILLLTIVLFIHCKFLSQKQSFLTY